MLYFSNSIQIADIVPLLTAEKTKDVIVTFSAIHLVLVATSEGFSPVWPVS